MLRPWQVLMWCYMGGVAMLIHDWLTCYVLWVTPTGYAPHVLSRLTDIVLFYIALTHLIKCIQFNA